MNKILSLTARERVKLHEIQTALAKTHGKLRCRTDIVGTRNLFAQFRSAIHLLEDVALRTRKRAVSPSDSDMQSLRELAHEAFRQLGSQAEPKLLTLKDYDHQRFGPFLGISDEGSATGEICRVAFESPKCVAFRTADQMVIGLALDAERLGAVGEVAVGPEEYRKIRLDSAHNILTTTNVGTRVNIRHYKNRPVVVVPPDDPKSAVTHAVRKVVDLMRPFWDTPGGAPRPVTVLVSFVGGSHEGWRKHVLLGILQQLGTKSRLDPALHRIGLQQKVPSGRPGVFATRQMIDMAFSCGIQDVAIECVQRAQAERTISVPGLLNYFPPGLLQEILDYASKRGVRIEPWKTVDTETTARNTWMGLSTARHMGLELGKYGLVPLTFVEQEAVIRRIQEWLGNWCAAPVHYVDLPHLDASTVYTQKNAVAGTARWLDLVGRCNVPVVLIDTAEKSRGTRLMKRSRTDSLGIFSLDEIADLNSSAQRLGVKVLWAGGLNAGQAYQLSQLGVFGMYVTSAAADRMAVTADYADDPMLAVLKEPTFDKVLRTKVIVEAGFLLAKMMATGRRDEAIKIRRLSERLLQVQADGGDNHRRECSGLSRLLVKCWRSLSSATARDVGSIAYSGKE